MISPVPGGAGVREGLMVAMARVYDVDSVAVLLAALVYRIALFAAIPILYAAVRFELRREKLEPTVHMHELTGQLENETNQPEGTG
ncbi:MAG: lysylphosphatidylglycerol synthase domain-containing protein [Thermomicrobiales bacterium]